MTRAAKQRAARDSGAAVTITENQHRILLRLFAGEDEQEIAVGTGRKPSTIFNTVRRVRAQLGARNEYDLMRECLRRGIVDLDEVLVLAEARRPASCFDLI